MFLNDALELIRVEMKRARERFLRFGPDYSVDNLVMFSVGDLVVIDDYKHGETRVATIVATSRGRVFLSSLPRKAGSRPNPLSRGVVRKTTGKVYIN